MHGAAYMAQLLRSTFHIALLVVLGVAAFLTPPDPVSQIIVALPLLGLYELSIYIAVWVTRARRRELGMTDE